nr:reverse transcriptase domain-containing protein [Tanacetum cinerariifolium]
MTDRKGKQCPIHYVSRTLNEAERNYAPIEKVALSFLYMTSILRRYFKAYPVKVITDQPIKQILSKIEASGKLAKYAIELGATNNEAEYEALLLGLRIARNMKIQNLEAKKADVLSKLASVALNHLTKEILVEVLNERSIDAKEINVVVEEEGDTWMTPIMQCLEKGI